MNPLTTRLLFAGLMSCAALGSVAQTTATITPKAQYDIDSKLALTQYKDDLKICDQSPDSTSRMQCKRDAKAEYDVALQRAKTRLGAPAPATGAVSLCAECAKVTSIVQTEKEGEATALGTIAGGLAGAVLGRQLGGGTGKDLGTLAGAAGGVYAGRLAEQKMKTHKVWTVHVTFADGTQSHYEFSQNPGLRVGDTVKKSEDTIVRY